MRTLAGPQGPWHATHLRNAGSNQRGDRCHFYKEVRRFTRIDCKASRDVVDLKKDVRGQTSHWHLDQPLTDMQVDYAANDALLHVLIYGKLYAEMQAHALVVEPLAGQDLASTETIPPTFSSEYIPIPAKVVVPQPDTKDQVKAKWTASQWELHSKLTARRDEILVKLGRNPKKEAHTVAHNNDSYVLVRDQPTTIDALENRSGMNQPLKTIFMYAFLNIV